MVEAVQQMEGSIIVSHGVDSSLKTNPDIGDQANMTALDIANAKGHEDVVALLQDHLSVVAQCRLHYRFSCPTMSLISLQTPHSVVPQLN